ncbi:MAG: hypothetical protein JSR39_10835 [Verrucomicrobia bacterium]|nr:hypothetical protein [Verrucomicrobiota bacterium]
MSIRSSTDQQRNPAAGLVQQSEVNQAYDPIEQFRWFNNELNTQGHLCGLRQEVPFERWFYHYAVVQNVSDAEISEKVKARAWAVASLGESLFRATVALVKYVISKIFCFASAEENLDVLRAQGNSISFSFTAVFSPEDAVNAAAAHGENDLPQIGSLFGDWDWGTAYYGESR